jgi:hypothetical protein
LLNISAKKQLPARLVVNIRNLERLRHKDLEVKGILG